MSSIQDHVPTEAQLNGTGPRTSKSRRDKRQYRGLTCANCRIRKVRCGGGLPRCKTCEIYDDNCRYDKAPPMSQVMAMMERLQEAERTIAELRSHGTRSPREENLVRPESSPQDHEPSDVPPDLSVDKNGEIRYYGPTSAVHDPPQLQREVPLGEVSTASPGTSSRSEVLSALVEHAQESKIWEDYALGNASLQTGIPRPIVAKLLHMNWIWVSPMFMYVYRPAFIRDMATSGRYYSEFLLTVMCAHAARYEEGNYANILLSRVRHLLGTAIQQPSSIPTVQALLQLSARELAHGSMSQAWNYSGIAFRMASDLGLEYIGPNVRGLGPVDLEIRKRLFWRATSLYAGRLPAITELPHHSTQDIVIDDAMELEEWSPYHGDSLDLTRLAQNHYPDRKSHAVSCFANSRTITEAALRNIKMRLDLWRVESPAHLRYDPDNLPSVCPPPHIISHYQVCILAAEGIEKLVLLLESTFGLENITYLMGYCIYTGASAILEDAKSSGQGAAHPVLRTFIRALQSGTRRCPLLERSLKIIIKGLSRVPPQQDNLPSRDVNNSYSNTRLSVATGGAPVNPYIPAFPYLGLEPQFDFGMDPYFNDHNINPMALLDCFPEIQMDNEDIGLSI
ncbi:fungal specific transcription factor [Paraphaeosphaeria sporulosa]